MLVLDVVKGCCWQPGIAECRRADCHCLGMFMGFRYVAHNVLACMKAAMGTIAMGMCCIYSSWSVCWLV